MTGQSIILRTAQNRDFALRIVGAVKIDQDRPFEIIIRPHRKKRSLNQNSLYWLWLGIIGREQGNDPDDLHDFFKAKFIETHLVTVFGEEMENRVSTTKLTVGQMAEYLDHVCRFAASEGIILPQPEDRRWAA